MTKQLTRAPQQIASGVLSCTVDGEEHRYHVATHTIKVASQGKPTKDGPGYGGWKVLKKHETKQEADAHWRYLEDIAATQAAGKKPAAVAAHDPHAKQLLAEFQQYELANRDVTFRQIRIGLICESKKTELKHGEFLPWLNAAVGKSRARQAYNFMKLARVFIEFKGVKSADVKLLCSGSAKQLAKASAGKLLTNFIAGRTQSELFEAYGITFREKQPIGGDGALRAWLKEHHPELAGVNSMRELPKDIRKAFTDWVHEQGQKGGIDQQAVTRDAWHALADEALAKVETYFLGHKHYALRDRAWMQRQREVLGACMAKLDDALAKES